jgi:hypothetical protein
MITGNVFDTFRLTFNDGEQFCLIARDAEHARLNGMELKPHQKIVGLQKVDLWGDDE